MANTVFCNNCETVLDEDSSEDPKKRKPCPKCGSKARKFFVSAEAQINFEVRSAALVLQTVVLPGKKTTEGQLIEAVALPWYEIIELLNKNPAVAYEIPARMWEEIIAGAYKKAGFDEVTLTPRSGDLGRDVIAIKRGLGSIRVIDQVKAYKPGHLVTANDVRALIGVLHGDGASKGFLTTTSDFAPKIRKDPLILPLIPARLELINGNKLFERLEELSKKKWE